MKTYKIACIPGDGIGKEVIPTGQEVLQALAAARATFRCQFTSFGWGGVWYCGHGKVMPDEIALAVSQDFPDVKWDKELVDACTARMVNRPASLDTLVATNLHADILSDLAAALAGSLGIAPTGNIDPERRYPSMFEPIHGSAFDIMGKGLANPVGTFWSVVMLLEHLGETDAAKRVMNAIEYVTADTSLHTRDLGCTATTAQVTEAVCAQIASSAKARHAA